MATTNGLATMREQPTNSGVCGPIDLRRSLLARRDWLRVGALTVAAHAVPASWLASAAMGTAGFTGTAGGAESVASANRSAGNEAGRARSVVVLWMAGGVTHIDSFDPKPQAPVEVRGVLGDIATSLPGVRFSETLPQLSRMAHELAVIRNFSHDSDDHLLSQVYTLSGRKVNQNQLFTEPNVGSVVSRLQGPRNGLPAYIAVPGITRPGPPPHNLFVSGWLGSQHVPYCLGGLPEQPDFAVGEKLFDPPAEAEESLTPASTSLGEDVPLSRLSRRMELRESFDQALRTLDRQDAMVAAESRYRDALRLLTTPSVRSAFDLSTERAEVRERYGRTKIGGRCLMARRLVEAGARFILVDYGYDSDYGNVWDNHNAPVQNHPPIQKMVFRGYHLAGMDRAFAALLGDLKERGLLETTLVVFLTEFGRTPKINANGGRDHWGKAGSIFLAGAKTRVGQVIGDTGPQAAAPTGHRYSPADVLATTYDALGIDSRRVIHDFQDRPRLILEEGRVIPEV